MREARYPTISVGGVSLEYQRLEGDPTRPTIVLLHEGLGCVALWRDFPEKLVAATGCPVFAYSRAGYGGSDPIQLPRPLDYMSVEAKEVVPKLLERAGISDHILVGHSDGATIALVYAGLAASPNLRSLVVLAPHIFAEQCGIKSIAEINHEYMRGGLRERLAKYHGTNVDCAFRGWCDAWLDPNFSAWSVESAISGIDVPLLQIQGRDDEYGTEAQLQGIRRASGAAVETLLLANCGHAPQFERSAETLAAIVEFCS